MAFTTEGAVGYSLGGSLFNINSELVFRISLYITNFLIKNDEERAKAKFNEVKDLYKARSSAVHGDKIKGELSSLVVRSANLLNDLIVKCITTNKLPNVDDLLF